ncbi:MAG: hypothetical protein FWB91_14380 [Defluviitaleaceae bacterium]|nr:hypothetical protein [Defluviitaleaceae bacterium]
MRRASSKVVRLVAHDRAGVTVGLALCKTDTDTALSKSIIVRRALARPLPALHPFTNALGLLP